MRGGCSGAVPASVMAPADTVPSFDSTVLAWHSAAYWQHGTVRPIGTIPFPWCPDTLRQPGTLRQPCTWGHGVPPPLRGGGVMPLIGGTAWCCLWAAQHSAAGFGGGMAPSIDGTIWPPDRAAQNGGGAWHPPNGGRKGRRMAPFQCPANRPGRPPPGSRRAARRPAEFRRISCGAGRALDRRADPAAAGTPAAACNGCRSAACLHAGATAPAETVPAGMVPGITAPGTVPPSMVPPDIAPPIGGTIPGGTVLGGAVGGGGRALRGLAKDAWGRPGSRTLRRPFSGRAFARPARSRERDGDWGRGGDRDRERDRGNGWQGGMRRKYD